MDINDMQLGPDGNPLPKKSEPDESDKAPEMNKKMGSSREDVYKSFSHQKGEDLDGDSPFSFSPDGETPEPEQDDKKSSDATDDSGSETPEITDESDPEESDGKDDKKGKSNKSQKTVPLAALQAERERRKEANFALKKLQEESDAKYHTLQAKVDALEMSKEENSLSDMDESSMSDGELLLLKKLKQQELELKKFKSQSENNNQQAQVAQVQRRTLEVDKRLSEEGFPGFIMSGGEIQQAVNSRLKEGLINQYDLVKEDAWIEAFKEDVFPKLKKLFGSTIEDKKNLKKGAKLASNAGTSPEKKVSSDKKYSRESYVNDYIKNRRSNIRG